MNIEWLSILLGWFGGIPTGLFVQWIYGRLSKRKRPKGESFNLTYTNSSMRFEVEGYHPSKAYIKRILDNLLGREETQKKKKKDKRVL